MINWFEKILLKRLLRHACPDRIPRSGEKGKRIRCYSIYLKNSAGDYLLLVKEMSSKGFCGTHWNVQYSTRYQASIPFSRMDDLSIEIERFIGLWEFTYPSIFKCVLNDWTYRNRIPIIRDAVDQFFFNRRDLALKEKTKVLKILVESYLNDPNVAFGEFKLVEILHGQRWIKHPDSAKQLAYARIILDSLRESGELQFFIENNSRSPTTLYKLTGKALTTLETYEREAIRHEQMISQSRHMKWLTFVLIIVGIIQAFVAYFHK